jgi:fumarate reductase flavoprotein subunit
MGQHNGNTANVEVLETEIVVIGGGAGLAAAAAAAEKGAKVVLLEKRKRTGGNVALATGLLAAESPVQQRLKIDVPRADLFNRWMDFAHWTIDPGIVRAVVDKSGDTIGWLEGMGVLFKDVPHFYFNQIPRIYHVPEGQGARLGKSLLRKCLDAGVEVLCETPASKILKGAKGEVAGVVAVKQGKEVRVEGRSVIVATGGYSGRRAGKSYHRPLCCGQ